MKNFDDNMAKRIMIDRLVDNMYLINILEETAVCQEIRELGDALQSGVIELNQALFCEHKEVRKIIRKAFSTANFIHFEIKG